MMRIDYDMNNVIWLAYEILKFKLHREVYGILKANLSIIMIDGLIYCCKI